MRKSILLFGAALAALMNAPQALAENWAGGYGGFRSDYIQGGTDYPISPGTPDQDSLNGGFMGVQAGYNFEFNNRFVLGARVSGEWGNATQTVHDGLYITEDGKVSATYSLMVIAGVTLGSTLVYLDYGESATELTQGEHCPDQALYGFCRPVLHHAPFDLTETRTVRGPTWGAGLEFHLSGPWSLAFEYSQTDYDNAVYVLSPDASGHPLPPSTVALSDRRAGVALNYHF